VHCALHCKGNAKQRFGPAEAALAAMRSICLGRQIAKLGRVICAVTCTQDWRRRKIN
jgi:hypothetical protein